MLIPMGIQNLYHEPATFNVVERTNVDKYIIATTWREMGVGLSGRSLEYSINYQAMLVNGFNGYDDGGVFSGKSGLRIGRQKGAESYITYPDFAGRVSYYGYPALNLGFSAYLAFDQAPSKFHKFEYFIIFSDKGDVLKIEVLNYNENYGAEICNKRWLKQFQKINTSSFLTYNNSIDGISGATLSVQSISANSWQVTQKLKTHLQLK